MVSGLQVVSQVLAKEEEHCGSSCMGGQLEKAAGFILAKA